GADGTGRDGRQRSRPARSRGHARRGRGARTEERHGGNGDREVDQRDDPELMRRRLVLVALLGCAAVAPAGAGARTQLTVYTAASLTDVFPKIDPSQRYSFGGSNTLAAQIQQGAPADVFASANTALPNQLY